MTGNNQQSATNESVRPRREGAIKDFVAIIGSLMMILCFGLLLEVNIRNWQELGQREGTIVVFVLLCLVISSFAFYIYCRLQKSCNKNDDDLSVAEIGQAATLRSLDPPPSYAKVMGTPPPTYHSLKISSQTVDTKANDEFIVAHI